MKKLKKMLLIHWHNYRRDVIEFDTINFLTGKTAAGKSTIIDALQLVLLGDTGGTFFNKAANQKSARTLKSYLFGEKGDDGDVGFTYLRNDRFSSYVVLEFEDSESSKKFTTGIVCECYKDQSFDYKWFLVYNHGLPENCFVDEKTNIPYDVKGLRAFLANWLGAKKNSEFELIDTNRRYQEVTRGKFGQINQKYRMLLKKAVPFSPISDIEKFITESICDVKNEINIEQMQSDIRQYKSLEEDARSTRERIDVLKEIYAVNQEYENEKEKYRQQRFVSVRAGMEEQRQEEISCQQGIQEKEALTAQYKEEIKTVKAECNSLKEQCEKLEQEYYTSDITQREKELKKELESLKQKIDQLEANIGEVVEQAHRYGGDWKRRLTDLSQIGFPENVANGAGPMLDELIAMDGKKAATFSFLEAASRFERLKSAADRFQTELRLRAEQLKQAVGELETTVSNLKKGIKPYPDQVITLKHVLEEELFRQHGQAVSVSVLADVLEIPRPRWRNAIEGYLDKQKFYLLVPEEFYQDSLRIYDQEKKNNKVFDAGLVDIGKLRRNFNRAARQGSLAEEIETGNADARLYTDYLLGGVMKCDNVDDLRKYKIAVTDEGMLYKGYVTRRIHPARYADPFIGRRSMELQLQQKLTELDRQKKLYEEVLCHHRLAKNGAGGEILSAYEAEKHEKVMEESKTIISLKQQSQRVKQEYDRLDFLYLQRMKEQIASIKKSVEGKEELWHGLDKKNERLDTELEHLKKEKLPKIITKITVIQREIAELFERKWIEKVGEPRFVQERNSNRRWKR